MSKKDHLEMIRNMFKAMVQGVSQQRLEVMVDEIMQSAPKRV